MRLVRLTAYHARIRLKRPIKHASHTRFENETLLIRAELDTGEVGWGEGLPREYVTGETIESCFETLGQIDWPQFAEPIGNLGEAITLLRDVRFPEPPAGARDAFGNTVRCALEIAILDAVTKAEQLNFREVARRLPEAAGLLSEQKAVRYGIAITSVKPWKEAVSAAAYRLYGFQQCKVKVGISGQDEPASLGRIRRYAGEAMDLRIDANEGWNVGEVEARLAALAPFGVTALEQPVPHISIEALREIRPRLGTPVMLDESLCSMTDAQRAIDLGLCDLFNLRLSKCGGFIACLLLAARAKSAGLGYQLGCMVGETGILSAAGRHFATSVANARYLEGSFDRYLVRDPLTAQNLTFGRGGLAPALSGPGLGITVDDAVVERLSVHRREYFSHTH